MPASESTSSLFGSININGSDKQTHFFSDEHAISSFSRASTGDLSFIASTPTHPKEIYFLSRLPGSTLERMTYNNSWINSVELGRQEVVTYQTRDE